MGEKEITGPASDAATSEEAKAAAAVSAEVFGLKTEPDKSAGDPEKDKAIKSEAEQKLTQSESTSKTGAEEKPTAGTEKKWAEKYLTPEALEIGHKNLQAVHSQVLNEKKQLEAEIERLKAEGAKAPEKKPEDQDKEVVKKPGYSIQELAKTNPKMAEAFTMLTQSLGEGEANALGVLLDAALENERSRYTQLEQKLTQTDQYVQNQQLREIEDEFYTAHPEAKDPELLAECEKIRKEILQKGNDMQYLLSLELDAAKGRHLDSLVDRLLSERVGKLTKEEINKMLASGVVAGAGGGAGGHELPENVRQSREAFGLPV